jgi:hypothetical protein
VQMKMNKVRVRHDTNLASSGNNTKKQSLRQANPAKAFREPKHAIRKSTIL